jgi:acetyl-CoA decarbonylase/synthase complex subunit delta
LAFQITTIPYTGKIREVVLGSKNTVTVGGETSYPFFLFEGAMPNKPKIAMEVWDMNPGDEWPEAAKAPFADVLDDPAAWARKCVDYGADLVVVQLKSSDPNAANKGAKEAVDAVKKVVEAVDVPVAVYGVGNEQKDIETLSAVAEAFQGKNLVLGPVAEKNHKQIGAQALAYGHVIAANTPIDINLAKQLNILLENLGVSTGKVLIDPTTGGLGYGMEYCYSVLERLEMAALAQSDQNLQQPKINNLAQEVWKTKEAKQDLDEIQTMGFPDDRAILMETTAAVALLLAGSDVVVLRHPETVKLVRQYIDLLRDGGEVKAAGLKQVQVVALDKLPKVEKKAAAPKKKEKKAAPAKKAEPEAKAAPKAAPEAKAAPKAALKAVPKAEKAPEPKAKEEVKKPAAPAEVDLKAQAEAEAKAKVEAETKAIAEAEAKKKAEAEAKAKAEAAAKAQVEAEAKAKAEAEAKAKAEAMEKEEALRRARAKEREEHLARRAGEVRAEGPRVMKKADVVVEKEMVVAELILAKLARVHRRFDT